MRSLFILLASTSLASAGGLVPERFNTSPVPVANPCQHIPWTECGVVREDGPESPPSIPQPVPPRVPPQYPPVKPPVVVEPPPVKYPPTPKTCRGCDGMATD